MEFFKKLRFSFLSIVMLLLLPFISVLIIGMAILNYYESYNAILEGFNKKLLSISSVTASFIDGDHHRIVSQPKKMIAMAKSPDTLYALSSDNILQRINLEKGAAIDIDGFDLKGYAINDLAYSQNKLYALTADSDLIEIDLVHKTNKRIRHFDFEANALAIDNETFYIFAKQKLYTLRGDELKFLKTFSFALNSMSYEKDILYGINSEDHSVLSINLDTLTSQQANLKGFSHERAMLSHLAMDEDYFYAGDAQLLMYERNSSTLLHEDFARQYRDETAEIYKKYHDPMSDIKVALNLTYHYTFELLYDDDESNCYYIFDVNEGNDYTPIGSYDEMDRDDLLGAESVLLRDETYVGDIKLWEKWGLLKVAYAGVMDSKGHVSAIVGTDVDMSIIRAKTKEALVKSVLIGIAAMMMGVLVAYFIARKIIKPIKKLKHAALKIAAGKYGDEVYIKSPRELNELSVEFNLMSNALEETVENFYKYSDAIKDSGISKELEKKLKEGMALKENFLGLKFDNKPGQVRGLVQKDGSYYLFSQKGIVQDKIEAIEKSAMLTKLLQRFLSVKGLSLENFIRSLDLEYFISFTQDSARDLLTSQTMSVEQVKEISNIQFNIKGGGQ